MTVNGALAYQGDVPADGILRLAASKQNQKTVWKNVAAPEGLCKRPNLDGPIETAFLSRFIVVVGTQGSVADRETNQKQANEIATLWRRWARGTIVRKDDLAVTDEDIRTSNLILIGGPRSNAIARRVNPFLPVRFEGDRVRVGQELFSGDGLGLKLVYPNPLNPDRLVVIFGGVDWRGTYDIVKRFGNWFDWGVLDCRNWFDFAVFDDRTVSPETEPRVMGPTT